MKKTTTLSPDQPIQTLTVSELEELIQRIVRNVFEEEYRSTSKDRAGIVKLLEGKLIKTFGVWEDPRSPETIITEIYSSRTVTSREINL
ncbi:MAG: hypothetical protein MUO64_10455 [Anaerolineales bacterium]|nr:hypothetical protein [Anaerolineales bacterium]